MEMFPTAKRTACDRCREHKLRCPPRGNPALPCNRCIRARKKCVTGFTKRLGRGLHNVVKTTPSEESLRPITPPSSSRSTAEYTPMSNYEPQRSQGLETPTSSLLDLTSTFMDPPRSPRNSLPSEWTHRITDVSTVPSQHDWQATSAETGTGPGYTGSMFENSASDPLRNVTPSLGTSGPGLWTHITPTTFGVTHAAASDHSDFNNPLCLQEHQTPREIFDHSNPSDPLNIKVTHQGLSAAEHDRQLSELSSDLCKQITKQDKLHTLCSGTNTQLAGMEQINDAIGIALSSNARFIAILQSCLYCRSGKGSQEIASEREVASSTLQLTCSLNAVTTYLRLVVLFDKLLLVLHNIVLSHHQTFATSYSAAAVHEAQVLPGLQLAGFSVSQSGFQARILVQAISHQFETIESLLAVPLEMQVSDRRSVYAGGVLLQGLDGQLLNSLLGGQFDMNVCSGRSTPTAQRIAPLASLRRSIDKVQEWARII